MKKLIQSIVVRIGGTGRKAFSIWYFLKMDPPTHPPSPGEMGGTDNSSRNEFFLEIDLLLYTKYYTRCQARWREGRRQVDNLLRVVGRSRGLPDAF